MIAFLDTGMARVGEAMLADMDRMVNAVSWGVAIAFDGKGRVAQKWNRLRKRRGQSGLSGADLESAVMALAAIDPSLVKIQPAT